MLAKDKIVKASWNLLGSSKDSLLTNISNAVRSGAIKVEPESVERLLQLVNTSIDEGYHRGYNVYERELDSALASHASATQPASTKKKLVGLNHLWMLFHHNAYRY